MNFYIGTHRVNHAKHFDRCFISANVLRNRKSEFEVNDWMLDSGAFTEISTYGQFRTSEFDYSMEIGRWAGCGNLEMAVTQDYMCEPFILDKTGMTIGRHQQLTISRYKTLVGITEKHCQVPIMPVIQGYSPSDYANHVDMYGDVLKQNMIVGVGSVCKRNSKPKAIVDVLEAIKNKRPDLRLHGFGLKTTALANAYVLSLLYSADSMAWSYRARRNGGNANGLQEALEFIEDIKQKQGKKPHQFVMGSMFAWHLIWKY